MTTNTYAELASEGGPNQYVTLLSVLGGLYYLGPLGAVAGPVLLSIPGIVWELFIMFFKHRQDEVSQDERKGSQVGSLQRESVDPSGEGAATAGDFAANVRRRQSPIGFLLRRATGLTFARTASSPP